MTYFYENILNTSQLQVLKNLNFLENEVYLAGGTALALQLGHRTSLDFDFYSKKKFRIESLSTKFKSKFKNVDITTAIDDTLIAEIDGINFSLFYYPYELLEDKLSFKNIKLASVPDIAAMKMIAISMRGKSRDFIDVYYLLKKFTLKQILDFTIKKYPNYQQMAILISLIYFDEADREEDVKRGIQIFDENFDWENAKKEIIAKVEEYQTSMLKH